MIYDVFLKMIRIIIPEFVRTWIRNNYFRALIAIVRKNHRKALKKLQKKIKKNEKVKVVFFLIDAAVWKLDYVFKFMLESIRFDPVIVICPYIKSGDDVMIETMNRAEDFIKRKGYPYFRTLHSEKKSWVDVKKEIKPDIVFFTNPYPLTRSEYLIGNFNDILTCYVPYSFTVTNDFNAVYNLKTHNLVWKYFIQTESHYCFARNRMINNARNMDIVGYPGIDNMFDSNNIPENVWINKKYKLKRIIWAPHHTIPGFGCSLDYSTFLDYFNFMLFISEKYKEHITVAFKPHPLLLSKLSLPQVWGNERADEYYKNWKESPIRQINDSDYIDLFLTSDALIHDSGSFMVEYLITGKPALFLLRDQKITERLNDFGKQVLKLHYVAHNKKEIINFIEDIITNKDPMHNLRKKFINENIIQTRNIFASDNIIQSLNKHIVTSLDTMDKN